MRRREIRKKAAAVLLLMITGDTVYINAQDVEWVMNMQLTSGEQAGEIKRTDVNKGFEDWDATVLEQGTVIYESDASEILLAEDGDELVPYLKYVEG